MYTLDLNEIKPTTGNAMDPVILQAALQSMGAIATGCSKLQKVLGDHGIVIENIRLVVGGFSPPPLSMTSMQNDPFRVATFTEFP